MTQLSTVANDEARPSASATLGAVASIALALAVGIGLGLLVSDLDAPSATPATGQFSARTHEQFLRMNTEGLDHLGSLELTTAAAAPPSDQSMVRNADSHGLSQAVLDRHMVGSHFYEINTSGFESGAIGSAVSPAHADDIVGNGEPFGHPNYGRLENYLGAQPTSGVR